MFNKLLLHQAIEANPADRELCVILADHLEEQGDQRGELIRLTDELTQAIEVPYRDLKETRLREILASVVRPIGPYYTNSIGMQFAWIPAGSFMMGSPKWEIEREIDEIPHEAIISSGFYMGIHPVTQEQWQAITGNNPSYFHGEINLPVEQVSWADCHLFLQNLSRMDNKSYRLPTEAEWEYSCRAGTMSPFHFGETISTCQANYNGNFIYDDGNIEFCREKTTPVGSFPHNAFGLFDMHGNVFEWCSDWLEDYTANELFVLGETARGFYKVMRGGSWNDNPGVCRSAFRGSFDPVFRRNDVGIRLAFSLE